MAQSNGMDDILRVNDDFDKDYVAPIKPMLCPRCGMRVTFETDGRIVCNDCGELYYDNWLGIWRIQPEVHED